MFEAPRTLGSEPNFTSGAFLEETSEEATLADKKVEEAKGQTSKGWYVLAIVIGSVVFVAAGGFGTVGLLKSYGYITLNQSFEWLSTAIGFAGNTPHFLSLWAIAAGGVVVGGGLIALGSYKIHTAGAETDKPENTKEEAALAPFSIENLAVHGAQDDFVDLKFNHFTLETRGTKENGLFKAKKEAQKPHFMVLRNQENKLLSTKKVDLETARGLARPLWELGLRPANAATAVALFFSEEGKELQLTIDSKLKYGKNISRNSYHVKYVKCPLNRRTDNVYIVLKTPENRVLYSPILSPDDLKSFKGAISPNFVVMRR